MTSILLATILTCSQIQQLSKRVIESPILNPVQKHAIIAELYKVIPTCPAIIKQK